MSEATEVLISSDGHAKVSHEVVKEHLATKYHEAYDTAVADFTRQMSAARTATNNQAWETNRRVAESDNSFRMRNMRQRRPHRRQCPPRRHGPRRRRRPKSSTAR